MLRGFYDVRLVDIEIEETAQLPIGVLGGEVDPAMGGGGDIERDAGRPLAEEEDAQKRMTVADARRGLQQQKKKAAS